jgi:hypothetical protein
MRDFFDAALPWRPKAYYDDFDNTDDQQLAIPCGANLDSPLVS